jgi:ABC-type multidrug transport system permease subunit
VTALGERPEPVHPTPPRRTERHVGLVATLGAYIRRDFLVARSYPVSFLLEVVSTVLQVALFFYLSRFIDTTELADDESIGGDYFGFVTIGLVLIRMIDAALTSFARTLRAEQTQGTLEALLAAPSSPARVILGSSCYSLLYGVVVSTLMLAVALAFGLELVVTPDVVVGVVVGVSASLVLFASLGVLVAAFIVVFKQGLGLLGLVSQALALLGGVYFPLSVFPEAVQVIADLIPFTWTVDFLRDALLLGDVAVDRLVLLVVGACVLLPAALWVLDRAVDRARSDGSLAHY